MLIDRAAFARLCEARAALCRPDEAAPSLASVAARLGVSRFRLIRQFRAVFGTTPRQAQIDARLERARELLAGGRHTVTDACMEVGFSSLGSFSALFTRRTGTTPSAYRRRARRDAPGCLTLLSRLPPP